MIPTKYVHKGFIIKNIGLHQIWAPRTLRLAIFTSKVFARTNLFSRAQYQKAENNFRARLPSFPNWTPTLVDDILCV